MEGHTNLSALEDELPAWPSLDLIFGFLFVLIVALYFTAARGGYDMPNTAGFVVETIYRSLLEKYDDGPIMAYDQQGLLRSPNLFVFGSHKISPICYDNRSERIIFQDDQGRYIGPEAKRAASRSELFYRRSNTTANDQVNTCNKDGLACEYFAPGQLPICRNLKHPNGEMIPVPPFIFFKDVVEVSGAVIPEFLPNNRGGRPDSEKKLKRECEHEKGQKCPGYISMVLIEGHADRAGDALFNEELAGRRAEAVREAFYQSTVLSKARIRGVVGAGEDSRMGGLFVAGSFGCRHPISNIEGPGNWPSDECPNLGNRHNEAEEGLNRRVDIRILIPVGEER